MKKRRQIAAIFRRSFERYGTPVKVTCPPKMSRLIKLDGPASCKYICIDELHYLRKSSMRLFLKKLYKAVVGTNPP